MSDQSDESTSNHDPLDANHDWDHDKRDRTPWTDGFFEIDVLVFDGRKVPGASEQRLRFSARPDELFEYEQETVTRTRGVWPVTWQRTYWRPIITGLKGMDFTSTAIGSQKLYIHPWDLTKYSNVWSMEFYEYDNSEDVTVTTSISTKFNTNLEVDASASIPGDIVKVGLKYGASLALEESETRSQI